MKVEEDVILFHGNFCGFVLFRLSGIFKGFLFPMPTLTNSIT